MPEEHFPSGYGIIWSHWDPQKSLQISGYQLKIFPGRWQKGHRKGKPTLSLLIRYLSLSLPLLFPNEQSSVPNLLQHCGHTEWCRIFQLRPIWPLSKSCSILSSKRICCPPQDGSLESLTGDKLVLNGHLHDWRNCTVPPSGQHIYCSLTPAYMGFGPLYQFTHSTNIYFMIETVPSTASSHSLTR